MYDVRNWKKLTYGFRVLLLLVVELSANRDVEDNEENVVSSDVDCAVDGTEVK